MRRAPLSLLCCAELHASANRNPRASSPPPRLTKPPARPPPKRPQYLEPAFHWGFIPAVLILGMYATKPRPTVGQFFFVG